MGKRIIQQRRGRGGRYKTPSFKYKGVAKHLPDTVESAVVKELVHCRGHSAPLMKVKTENNQEYLMIAPEGICIGQEISLQETEPKQGHSFQLKNIPDGTIIYNLELRPGDGGKIARASGTFAKLVQKTGDKVVILLPSKKKKIVKIHAKQQLVLLQVPDVLTNHS